MPERVWLTPAQHNGVELSGVWLALGPVELPPGYHQIGERADIAYVPESALAAAEARVREMEEQASRPVPLDYGRHPITDARRDFIHHALTYPGFVGNRDLFVEAARDLAAEAATLRAERDALVPLLRYFVEYVEDGMYEWEDPKAPDHACDFLDNPESGYCEFHDKWGEARAILAREAGE